MDSLIKKIGNQFFKYRGQIPFLLILASIATLYSNKNHSNFVDLFGKPFVFFLTLLFTLLGHTVRALVIGYRDLHTSGKNRHQQVAEVLNTSGMYSLVRHPLYVGNLLIWIGLLVWLGNFWFLLIALIFFSLFYYPIISVENQFLQDKFGDQYISWAEKTPILVPRKFQFTSPNNQFSYKMVWKNEYPGIVSTLSSIWFISLLRLMFTEQKCTISSPLLVFALLIALFGFCSRYLKYKTNFFPKMG